MSKLISSKISSDKWAEVDTGAIAAAMRALDEAAGLVPGLTEGKCIIEEQIGDQIVLSAEVTLDGGEGSNCAAQKIKSLRTYPGVSNTGELKLYDQKELKDEGCVSWYGGVQIKVSDSTLSADSGKIAVDAESNYIFRVVFSGAREDADTLIAVHVLRVLLATIRRLAPNMVQKVDWAPLKDNPVSGLALNLLRN
ncbi:MAG: hypothetical protein LBM97_01370 [Candidatus Nomurabacteria bacterium]|jgi:hypothetical protein|nr:hypothetical protein [Candidatus Nomurabacteria bacterium]